MWILPTGHTGSTFINPGRAYDNDTATYAHALTLVQILLLTHTGVWCDKVRIYASDGTGNPNLKLEVYYSAGWNTIFSGSITKNTLVEKSLASTQFVTQARITCNAITSFVFVNEFAFSYPFIGARMDTVVGSKARQTISLGSKARQTISLGSKSRQTIALGGI